MMMILLAIFVNGELNMTREMLATWKKASTRVGEVGQGWVNSEPGVVIYLTGDD